MDFLKIEWRFKKIRISIIFFSQSLGICKVIKFNVENGKNLLRKIKTEAKFNC